MRLLIIGILVYLLYRAWKSWQHPSVPHSQNDSSENAGQIDDIMVKDPFCNVYFPRSKGIHMQIGDRDVYFCSAKCRDGFLETHSGKGNT